jgi:hypothetical protein
MGMFSKMKDAQAQAAQAQAGAMSAGAGIQMGASGGMAGQMAYAQLAQKLGQSGVEAQGVVHSITATGNTDMGGGQETQFDVSIKPADGSDPFSTTITQSMLPAQLEGISEGAAITVKYDPDAPTSALIYGW